MTNRTGLERLWALIEEHREYYRWDSEIYGKHYLKLIDDMETCYKEIFEAQTCLVQDKTDCEMRYERLTQGGLPIGSDRQPDSRSPVQD